MLMNGFCGCGGEKNKSDFIDSSIGNVTKGMVPDYRIASESKNNNIWQARILIPNVKLNEPIARRIASKILHDKFGAVDAMMFTILGVEKKENIPLYLQIYRVKAAKTKQTAVAIGRWDKRVPFIEFVSELTPKK